LLHFLLLLLARFSKCKLTLRRCSDKGSADVHRQILLHSASCTDKWRNELRSRFGATQRARAFADNATSDVGFFSAVLHHTIPSLADDKAPAENHVIAAKVVSNLLFLMGRTTWRAFRAFIDDSALALDG
jgi:hypothetical protein